MYLPDLNLYYHVQVARFIDKVNYILNPEVHLYHIYIGFRTCFDVVLNYKFTRILHE